MPIEIRVGKKSYSSNNKQHAEEVMFASAKYGDGDFTVEMDGWPCTGEKFHNCHQLFKNQSKINGRTITVNVTGDHAGYAKNHGRAFGAVGTITYTNGLATYS